MADFYSTLRGVMGLFRIGGADGPQLKRVGTAIEHRNAADGAYVNARGADSVTDDDFITQRQFGGFGAFEYLQGATTADAAGNWTFTFPTVYPRGTVISTAMVEIDSALVAPASLPLFTANLQLFPGGVIGFVHQGNVIQAGPYPGGINQGGAGFPVFAMPFRIDAPLNPAQIRFTGSGATDGATGLDVIVRATLFVP